MRTVRRMDLGWCVVADATAEPEVMAQAPSWTLADEMRDRMVANGERRALTIEAGEACAVRGLVA